MHIKSLDSSMVIINDNRSSALQLIKSRVYHKWKSKSNGQEQFACDGPRSHHSEAWLTPNDHSLSPSTRLTQLECPDCDGQPLTLAHLMLCRGPTALYLHRDLLHFILDEGFGHIPECQRWLSHATIRCVIGAFTIGQSTSAISRLGKDLKVGRSAFITIRRVCLQHIGQFYHTIKQQPQQPQKQQ